MIDSLDVWNAEVFGRVSTGPGGTVKIGPNGAVGSKAWHDGGNSGIEPGYGKDDMNVEFPDVQAPFSGGAFNPSTGGWGGTNYTYILDDGNYQMTALSLSGNNGRMLVKGDAVLLVTGDVSLSGKSYIYIAPGASLQMYVQGASASFGGNGIVNSDADATSFGYWGLSSNTSISMSGNAAFTGTIYAPYAHLHLGGGGNNDYDFVGASITGSVKMNGHFKFHYDEALKKFGPSRGYAIVAWNEASVAEIDALPGL
jgi:hypothetical protein